MSELIKGCCPLDCQDTCCWVAHVEDGRVVKVAGAKEHPFTRGVLCAKVKDYEQRTYAPDRLLYPLRRCGPKGSGTFERITWDQAIDSIADEFHAITAEHGAEALMPLYYLGSLGVVQHDALRRLFHAMGASRLEGSICGQAGNALAAEGFPIGFDPEDIVDAELIVVWGANMLTTCHHHWHFVTQARKQHGARIVAIDPRTTRTAEGADEHLAIRPGTDAVLAAGIARVLIEEGLADLEYASTVAADLDQYVEQVAQWPPDRVAATCGLEADAVVGLAREFGAARPAVIRVGIGPQQSVHGETFVRSLSALAILGGHWQHRGGGLFLEAYPDLDTRRATRPDLTTGHPRRLDMARLGEILTDPGLDPPIKGMMIWLTNPAVVQPDATRVRDGLCRADLFTVVVEHFLTDTARFADVVVPSTTQLEHFDIVGSWGHHYISVNNPAVAPLGESKSHGEIMRLLAERLGLTHPALQESDEQIASSALPDEVDFERLMREGWYKTSPSPAPLPPPGDKLHLSGGPLAAPPLLARDRLQLLTPKGHFFLNSSFANMERQRTAMQRPTLDMHPADAGARGLADGRAVCIQTEHASLHAWLRVTDEIRSGVVALPGKWWSTPADTGAVTNLLMSGAWSPRGQPAYNDVYVTVSGA